VKYYRNIKTIPHKKRNLKIYLKKTKTRFSVQNRNFNADKLLLHRFVYYIAFFLPFIGE